MGPDTQLEIVHCDILPSLLPRVGDLLGCVLKRGQEEMERTMEEWNISIKSCIRTADHAVVAIREKASMPAKRSDNVSLLITALFCWSRK